MIEPLQSEIMIRKENGKSVPWLAQSYVLKACDSLSEEYLRVRVRPLYRSNVPSCFQNNNILPDTGKAWRWAKIDGQIFYCYDNIPNVAPNYYQTNFPCRRDLVEIAGESQQTISTLESHLTDYYQHHYITYLSQYGDCSKMQQRYLAQAAAITQGCIDYITQRSVDIKKKTFFMQVAAWLEANDVKYLPFNYRRLKEKIVSVMEGEAINEVISLPRKGNDNRRVFNDAEIESWIMQMRVLGNNYTNAHIIRKVQQACELTLKPVPSVRWIGQVMEKPNTDYITALHRYGSEGRYGVFARGYIPLKNAVFAGDCWQVDGTRVNLIDHKHKRTDAEGKETKSQEYLYMIMVRDVHSGDILGHSFGLAEDRWHYINALKMAVENAGYLPWQLVFDRFPGHNTPEFMSFQQDIENRGVKVTFTSKSTGKAKIERWIETFQDCFLQDSSFYYGQGIKSRRKYAHRSEEYLKSARKKAAASGWDFDAACNETDNMITAYRTTPLCKYSRKHSIVQKSPSELHQDSDKPNVIIIEQHSLAYIFGLRKEIQIKNGGLIHTDIMKYPFIYRITDYSVISKHKSVIICYTLDDLSQVHLYEVSDKPLKKYLGVAQEAKQPQLYGPNAEWGELNRQKAIIREIDHQRETELSQRLVSGSDIVSILMPGSTSKHKYEAAETNLLKAEGQRHVAEAQPKKGSKGADKSIDGDVLNML